MGKVRVWIRAMFGFSQSETNGFLLLIPLSLGALLSAPLYDHFASDDGFDSFVVEDSLVLQWLKTSARPPIIVDPNAASDSLLEAAGLKPWLAKRLVKFRERGAVFRKREDLLKVYAMDTAWVRMQPMVFRHDTSSRLVRKVTRVAPAIPQVLDLNLADTLQLQMVRGIGPGKARRIVAYREKLGGYVRLEQLKEVYGLDSANYREVIRHFHIAPGFKPRMLLLNSATWEEFSAHPYISKKEAIALVAYRTQHSRFDSVGQIMAVRLIPPERVSRMRQYLKTD